MHDHDKPQQATTPPQTHEPLDTAHVPTGPAALLALQRSIGNAAVARMFGAPAVQRSAVQRSAVHDVLRSAGRPLDTPVRTEMEARLGADFSDVRVHTDAAARRSATELGAHAYTSGNHVVVGAGGGDRHTLAHELTHVIQQRSGPVPATPTGDGVSVSDPGDAYERAAEANARRVMAGPTPTAHGGDHHGHDHTTDPHTGHDHSVQRTPVVQRMTM
ncbi:eCIS core domain-containing protein, partial [Saccharothrix deserti]|uniref:eCIS core domain-containing protein n=1 Tax=Saccharothrix deserti TaxID=2593674 RepID=UPI001EE49078